MKDRLVSRPLGLESPRIAFQEPVRLGIQANGRGWDGRNSESTFKWTNMENIFLARVAHTSYIQDKKISNVFPPLNKFFFPSLVFFECRFSILICFFQRLRVSTWNISWNTTLSFISKDRFTCISYYVSDTFSDAFHIYNVLSWHVGFSFQVFPASIASPVMLQSWNYFHRWVLFCRTRSMVLFLYIYIILFIHFLESFSIVWWCTCNLIFFANRLPK